MSSLFLRSSALSQHTALRYTRVLTRKTGQGLNTHRSNKAKNGLYHGRDIMSGFTVSFSKHKEKRKWYPNVINKKLWSESLNDWVRFKMTTAALKGIDKEGGIDNYLMNLDERSVQDSNYITKMRRIVGTAMFLKGFLNKYQIRKLGFDKSPPEAMPLREEYNREREPLPSPEERGPEHLQIRKMKKDWKTPRYF